MNLHETTIANHVDSATAPLSNTGGPATDIAWLLEQFTATVPGVTDALLLGRDGLKLVDSGIPKDWADTLAAALSGLASLAQNITGPTEKKMAPQQIMIEREDALFFVTSSGTSAAFEDHPGNTRGMVDTVLGVITRVDAEVGTVGYEMGRLVDQFAPYMVTEVRNHAIPSDDA